MICRIFDILYHIVQMPLHAPGYYFVLSEYKPVIGSKQITFRRKNAIIKTTFLGYKSNLICPTCIFWQFACIVPAIFDIDTHDGMSGKHGRNDYVYKQTDKTKSLMVTKHKQMQNNIVAANATMALLRFLFCNLM